MIDKNTKTMMKLEKSKLLETKIIIKRRKNGKWI